MKTNLKNENVFEIAYLLKTKYLETSRFDKRFNFAVGRTLSNLQPIVEELIKSRESSIPRFKEFEQKRMLILKKYQKEEGKFESDEDKIKATEEVKNLVEEYKDALEARDKEAKAYNEILEQEIEVDIVQCKFEALPNDFDFNNLRIMLKETDEEIEALI
jgi:hypothetical protein